MQRALGVIAVALIALLIIQFVAIRRMRLEMARLRAEIAAQAIQERQTEIARTGEWLHAWMQSPAGGSRAGGLCPEGTPDLSTITRFIYGVYLPSRAAGASEADSRRAVMIHAQ